LNRVSAWELASPSCAFAWGGAMAIRKEVFDKARVIESWDRAADDDLSLTTAVKALGLDVTSFRNVLLQAMEMRPSKKYSIGLTGN